MHVIVTDVVVSTAATRFAPDEFTVTVPDEGIYWYHTHLREDVQQPMGLYGNILVMPSDANAYGPVNREEVLAVTDLLLDRKGNPVPYGTSEADGMRVHGVPGHGACSQRPPVASTATTASPPLSPSASLADQVTRS